MKPATFAQRLREAMHLRRLNQTDLHDLTGIGKPSISTYLKGEYKAKQDKVDLLATVLDVNPAWLMGYDVSMDSSHSSSIKYTIPNNPLILAEDQAIYSVKPLSNKQKEVLENIQDLNDEQLDKLLEYILFIKSR